jgi:hypothetical protein
MFWRTDAGLWISQISSAKVASTSRFATSVITTQSESPGHWLASAWQSKRGQFNSRVILIAVSHKLNEVESLT